MNMILQDNLDALGVKLSLSRYETAELTFSIFEGLYNQNESDLPEIKARINCLSEGRVEAGFTRGNKLYAMARFEDSELYPILDVSDTDLPVHSARHSIHI